MPDTDGVAWPDYIKEATREAEAAYTKHGGRFWVQEYRRRKWNFAGKAARATDARWTHRILDWTPAFGRGRGVGRPRARWSDPIAKLAGGDWKRVAENASHWQILRTGFVEGL